MAKILFAWELGSNFGHLQNILPLARSLKKKGHSVVLVIKDLYRFSQLDQKEFIVLQSPLPKKSALESRDSYGYADILALHGYSSANELRPLFSAWRHLIISIAPDLIACHYAPTALLAAHSTEHKALSFGTGFLCPPAVYPLPGFGSMSSEEKNLLEESERNVVQSSNSLLREVGGRELKGVADLFFTESVFLCTVPELDHYGARNNIKYWGCLYSDVYGDLVSFPSKYSKNILVYLNSFENLNNYLAAFKRIKANFLIVFSGLSNTAIKSMGSDSIKVVNKPVPLQPLLDRCDLLICHGGPGISSFALDNGVPLLLLPSQKEQMLFARKIVEHNFGMVASIASKDEHLQEKIYEALSREDLRRNALDFQCRYSGFSIEDRVEALANSMAKLATASAN